MARWKIAMVVVALIVAIAASVSTVVAQQAEQPRRGGRQERGRWGDPEQMRQRMTEWMKETLGASDEEWAVIGPRLEAVQTLMRDARGGGMGMFAMFGRGRGGFGGPGAPGFGGPGGPGGPAAPAGEQAGPQQPQTDVQKTSDALDALLQDPASTPDQIKQALTAYREAREKARQELVKAQEALREVLSVRQEAQLVFMGTLD